MKREAHDVAALLIYRTKNRDDWELIESAMSSPAARAIEEDSLAKIGRHESIRKCHYCKSTDRRCDDFDAWGNRHCSKCGQAATEAENTALAAWLERPVQPDVPLRQIIERHLSNDWDATPLEWEGQQDEHAEAKRYQKIIRETLASFNVK